MYTKTLIKFLLVVLFLGLVPSVFAGICPGQPSYGPTHNQTLASMGFSSCIYVSTSGADTNTGASKNSAWLHVPGQLGCSNNCLAHNPSGLTEAYIFEGNDVWDKTKLGIAWIWDGTFYFGVDKTWYSGAQWGRPVFDCGLDSTCAANVFASSINVYAQIGFVKPNANSLNVYVDGIEFKGLYIPDYTGTYSGALDAAQHRVGVYVQYGTLSGPTTATLQDLYCHGWGHASQATNNGPGYGNIYCVNINDAGAVGSITASIYTSVCSGSDTAKDAGWCWNAASTIDGTISEDMAEGIDGDFNNVTRNIVRRVQTHYTNPNIGGAAHCDLIQHAGPFAGITSNAVVVMSGNVVYDDSACAGVTVFGIGQLTASTTNKYYVHDNVVYQNGQSNIYAAGGHVDPNYGIFYIYNNFGQSTASSALFSDSGLSNSAIIHLAANQMIAPVAPLMCGTVAAANCTDHGGNIVQTPTQAITSPNNYISTSTYPYMPGGMTWATIGTGLTKTALDAAGFNTDASALDTSVACSYDATAHWVTCPNRIQIPRPTTSKWDSGPYQFTNCPTRADYGYDRAHTLANLGITKCMYVAANGSDSNDGYTPDAAWLHAPGMTTCVGNCANELNGTGGYPGMVGGTAFIFRGGDTWHFGNSSATPYTGGFWNIWGIWGYRQNADRDNCYDDQHTTGCTYFGVDKTWYKTGDPAWTRPKLTADNPISSSYVDSCAYQVNMNGQPYSVNVMLQVGVASMVDNFEMFGLCSEQIKSNPITAPQDAYISLGGAEYGGISMDFATNMYVHGWTVAKKVHPKITAIVRTSNVVRVTTEVPHGWNVNDVVIIEGVTGWVTDVNSYDGNHGSGNPSNWTITAIDTTNHMWFEFAQAAADETINPSGLTNAYANSNQIPLAGFNGGANGMATMDYNIVNGADSQPGTLIWAWAPSYYHLRYNYMTNAVGAVGQQCHDIHDNVLDNQQNPSAPTHGNILECNFNFSAFGNGVQHPKNTPNVFYNNIIRHASTAMADAGNVKLWLTPSAAIEYHYNNIMYDLGPGNFYDIATLYYGGTDFLTYAPANIGMQRISAIEINGSNVLKLWTKGKYETKTSNITSVSFASGVITFTSNNSFTNQNWVELTNLTTNTYLNGKQLRVQMPDWQGSHSYLVGDIVWTGTAYQEVQIAGTSGANAPTWATTVGNTTVDGGVTWINDGTTAPRFKLNFPVWQASHDYAVGEIVVDSNGNYQRVSVAGKSIDGSSGHPAWATVVSNTTTDGGITWINDGTTSASVTNGSLTGTATYVHPFPNWWWVGLAVKLEGFTTNTYLNGQTVVITGIDTTDKNSGYEYGDWFTANFTHAAVPYSVDTGFARRGGLKMFNNTLVTGSPVVAGQPCYGFVYTETGQPDMNLTVFNEHLISTIFSYSPSNTYPCTGYGDVSNVSQTTTQAFNDGYTTDVGRINFSVSSLADTNCDNETTIGPCRTISTNAATVGKGRDLTSYCNELAQYATAGTINGEAHDAEYGIGVTAYNACLHGFPNRVIYDTNTNSIVLSSFDGNLRNSAWDSGAWQFANIINSFTRSHDININAGSATLSWSTTASNCSLDNGYGAVAVNGSATVIPTRTTIYTLTCDGQQMKIPVFVGGAEKH